MLSTDPELSRALALRAIEGGLLRLKWLAAATRFELALLRHDRALKYRPDQPRVPAGNPDGGRWTSESTGDGRLGQGLKTASDQEARGDQKQLEDIANNPVVRPKIEDAWNASTAHSPQEHGFWITRDDTTGEVSTRPFENAGAGHSIVPGPVPSDAIAFFHTHPNRPEDGYAQGPSAADQQFAARIGLPGLIQSHSGMYYFGPTLRTPSQH